MLTRIFNRLSPITWLVLFVWLLLTGGYLWWLIGRINQPVELPADYQSVVARLNVELVNQAADKLRQAQPLTYQPQASNSASESSEIDK